MGKDPAFLFYPNDYIGGTMGMTFEEKGAYMEILMMQFNRGHMTSHMIGQTIGQLWDTVQVKFVQDDKGLWYNERLEEEQNKRKLFTDSRKNNIKGINQHTKKVGHTTTRMEDEDVNEDRGIVVVKNYQTQFEKLKAEIKIPESFEEHILLWLKYKSEKGSSYKPTGLKTFLKSIVNDFKTVEELKGAINHSMKNNYAGLFKPKNNGTTEKSDKSINTGWKDKETGLQSF